MPTLDDVPARWSGNHEAPLVANPSRGRAADVPAALVVGLPALEGLPEGPWMVGRNWGLPAALALRTKLANPAAGPSGCQ